jgi:hypothetical protein
MVKSRFGCGSGTGSSWSPLTVVTFVSKSPSVASAGTVPTIVSVRLEPSAGFAGTLGAVQVTAPVEPTAGVEHESGGLAVALTKPTPAGS